MSANDFERNDTCDRCYEKVGYAYVPFQYIGKIYTPEKAVIRGTIFPELDICLGEYERGLYDGK